MGCLQITLTKRMPIRSTKILFRYLFKEKSGMLELYNALFDDCLTDESEIEDCTIEDVFTRQMKTIWHFVSEKACNCFDGTSVDTE